MKIPANTETKTRTIGGTREVDGIEFEIPRPFQPSDFTTIAETYGVDASGIARSLNQTLAENVTNNKGSQIKSIREFNEKLEKDHAEGNRLDVQPKDYPTQDDIDAYIAEYDFSGVRESSGDSPSLSMFERELWKLAKQQIRAILKSNGKKVAKKDSEPESDNEISWDKFEDMAGAIVNLEGPWGDPSVTVTDPVSGEEVPLYYNKAQELHELARKTEQSAKEVAFDSSDLLK